MRKAGTQRQKKQEKFKKTVFGKTFFASNDDAAFEAEIRYVEDFYYKTYILVGRVLLGEDVMECGRLFGYWPLRDIKNEEEQCLKKVVTDFLRENYLGGIIGKDDFMYAAHDALIRVLGRTDQERFLIENPQY